jgi:cytochrome oxidase Cu insertion factor (SCO1/SenC/PrrC family)
MKIGMVLSVAMMSAAGGLVAQQPQPPTPLAVGTEAPDFTLPSATRSGVGKPVSLRDFRGQVVVLAFFFRARTSG